MICDVQILHNISERQVGIYMIYIVIYLIYLIQIVIYLICTC